jgi:hypothetical protein
VRRGTHTHTDVSPSPPPHSATQPGLLQAANSSGATYLFQPDKPPPDTPPLPPPLLPHPGLLQAANSSGATYLFQPDKLHTDMDIGDKSLQCGRKSDSLKIWWAPGEGGLQGAVGAGACGGVQCGRNSDSLMIWWAPGEGGGKGRGWRRAKAPQRASPTLGVGAPHPAPFRPPQRALGPSPPPG